MYKENTFQLQLNVKTFGLLQVHIKTVEMVHLNVLRVTCIS